MCRKPQEKDPMAPLESGSAPHNMASSEAPTRNDHAVPTELLVKASEELRQVKQLLLRAAHHMGDVNLYVLHNVIAEINEADSALHTHVKHASNHHMPGSSYQAPSPVPSWMTPHTQSDVYSQSSLLPCTGYQDCQQPAAPCHPIMLVGPVQHQLPAAQP